jgi:hypothetical protein
VTRHQNEIGTLPLPVLRERAGVRVMANVKVLDVRITLILTFSRSTGRRDQSAVPASRAA